MAMTVAEGRRQRKALDKDRHAAVREKARAKVHELAERLSLAKSKKRNAVADARAACKRGHELLAERRKQRRERLLAELREVARQETAAARARCDANKAHAAASAMPEVERARLALEEERKYQADLRRIEANNKKSRAALLAGKPAAKRAAEHRSESDDEVRANLPPELVPFFETVRGAIKGSTHKSRTEAFLEYAAENPDDVVRAQDARTDEVIAELEAQVRTAHRYARKPRYTARELAEVPF